ncbi:MAG: GDP-mannose 4,6-dehydratase [Candidatus Thermoplasmatota archaeon]|nr:GDP-mannose 4,6-dehydratase [Candidatus Thermoplasmatota archaeon]
MVRENRREGYTTATDTVPETLAVQSIDDFYRPAEADNYRADYGKAKRILGWEPETTFDGLVEIMVQNDLLNVKNSAAMRAAAPSEQ